MEPDSSSEVHSEKTEANTKISVETKDENENGYVQQQSAQKICGKSPLQIFSILLLTVWPDLIL